MESFLVRDILLPALDKRVDLADPLVRAIVRNERNYALQPGVKNGSLGWRD